MHDFSVVEQHSATLFLHYPFQAGEFESKSTILLTNKYEGRELYPPKFRAENLPTAEVLGDFAPSHISFPSPDLVWLLLGHNGFQFALLIGDLVSELDKSEY
ncbi:predicted protein [Histoplasma capsulatum var. duboisii H88]|uniref:Predicted protein n=2 Tax=Ajellomyces capsulatus TaxID=5037 RepID=F0UMZ0_AJEC8|nr:predicted protein [Histoplasma capsulatum H143]EGC47457.1 predicted protein [Histoplasma capsulatum var. duboisii H88]